MKRLIALVVGAGALGAVAAASPVFAQDTAVDNNGYITGSPAYASGPMGILALPFQVATAPFQMFQPANGALGPTSGRSRSCEPRLWGVARLERQVHRDVRPVTATTADGSRAAGLVLASGPRREVRA